MSQPKCPHGIYAECKVCQENMATLRRPPLMSSALEVRVRELSDRRSLKDHGPFSAYCKVCWLPVYCLWIDDEPHNGSCMYGHTKPGDCQEAMKPDCAAAIRAGAGL